MKINVTNTEKVQSAIDTIQTARMTERLIDAEVVQARADALQAWLDERLYRKDQPGLTFRIDEHGQNFPHSYKGTPYSTRYTLERTASGWFLVEVFRGYCQGPTQTVQVDLTDKADALARYAMVHISRG